MIRRGFCLRVIEGHAHGNGVDGVFGDGGWTGDAVEVISKISQLC